LSDFESALAFHQNNELEQAEVLYRKLIKNNPEDINSAYFLSLLLYQTYKFDEAILNLNKILENRPQNAFFINCNILLGEIFYAKNDIKNAEKYFLEALSSENDNFLANFNLGRVYLELKDFDKSIKYFIKSLRAEFNQKEIYLCLIQAYLQKNNIDGVINSYLKLIELEPSNHTYYFDIATFFAQKKDTESEFKSYLNAIYLKPDYAQAHINLGILYHRINEFQKAENHLIKGLELNDNLVEPYKELGNLYIDTGATEKVVEISEKGLKKFPDTQYLLFNTARAKLLSGNIDEGWEYFRLRRILNEKKLSQPYLLDYNGDLKNKKVLVYWDTGFGDSIQFLRYVSLLKTKGAQVKFMIQKPLVTLAEDSELGAEIISAGSNIDEQDFDFHINLTSLAYLFKTDMQNFPLKNKYLKANVQKVQEYKEKYFNNDCFKIGVSWQGSGISALHKLNNIEHVNAFLPFAKMPNVKLYSILKGEAQSQLKDLPKEFEMPDLGETFGGFSETAAVIENLDLLIVADSAYAHLGGALGKQTWVMIPHNPNWRWFKCENTSVWYNKTPWYENAKLFRQKEAGSWQEVLQRMEKELNSLLSK